MQIHTAISLPDIQKIHQYANRVSGGAFGVPGGYEPGLMRDHTTKQ